ncbi:Do family serine endopeptidase [Ahrensia kielensis]|uniref:Probable periplasmic serine endoprotease DegP-like n=1 Tax=Ahrensia kielensis TaxID=76980 RepID=A0ABU9T9F4_9HYPH
MQKVTKRLSQTAMALAVIGAGFTGYTASSIMPAYADAVDVQTAAVPGFADVVDAVSPAVVSVRVKSNIRPVASQGGDFQFNPRGNFEDQLRRFFEDRNGNARPNRDRRTERSDEARPIGQGSGFFISEDGFLVTNNHVVEDGTEFTVLMDDGTELDATLIGKDQRTDLAVLKVDDDREFTYVDFADENDVRIGDWVVAVGNPFGLGGTVTAGILSARGRDIGAGPYDDFLQIDAAVNRGNSGGPTFNLSGKVVGINTAIYSPSGGNVGIAFAVPATLAKEVISDLMKGGSVERGWLGVAIQPVTADIAESLGLDAQAGALVSQPQKGAPAEAAGIRAGDIITEVNGREIKDPRTLSKMIAAIDPGSDVEIKILRSGKEKTVNLKLGELPVDVADSGSNAEVQPTAMEDLGLTVMKNDQGDGIVVTSVEPGSSASDVGIRAGDIISEVNNEPVSSAHDIESQLETAKKDGRKAALLRLENESRSRFVAVQIG